jgi:adenylosuccinate synthase
MRKVEDNGPPTYYPTYTKEVMQQLPCGWTNRKAVLVIGPGAVVDMEQLVKELDHVEQTFDPEIRKRILISAQAFPLTEYHHKQEGGIHGSLHAKIGSTGHGVGAARHERMARDPESFRGAHHPIGYASEQQRQEWRLPWQIADNIPDFFNERLMHGDNILLEGTQGSGLSLIHGPWPFVTSADTNVGQLLADAGIPPRLLDRTIMVCRTYPIRVAGNSGPMHHEITWEELNRRIGKHGVTEQTTVTKKTRRISEWDEELVLRAITLNAPTDLAITFLDYISPADEGKESFDELSDSSKSFIEYVEALTEVPVTLCGTGGAHWSVIDRGFDL